MGNHSINKSKLLLQMEKQFAIVTSSPHSTRGHHAYIDPPRTPGPQSAVLRRTRHWCGDPSWRGVRMNARADADDLRDMAIASAAREHAKRISDLAAAGDAETLSELADAWSFKVSKPGVTEHLISTDRACGAGVAGATQHDLIQSCIDDMAEICAMQDIEQVERDLEADQEARAEWTEWERGIARMFLRPP
jgi:hypothetical protein